MTKNISDIFLKTLEQLENNLNTLPLNIYIPKNTWIYEAKKNLEELVHFASEYKLHELKVKYSNTKIYKFQICFSNISELNNLFEISKLISENSYKGFSKRVNLVLNSSINPLMPENESKTSNEGRNTMFELRLFERFLKSEYKVEIPEGDHPDFIIFINDREYPIECKRIFSIKSFKKNIERAINQLNTYSLKKNNELGIVAVNISRAFNLNRNGNLFISPSQSIAEKQILNDFYSFKRLTLNDYKKITFPTRIPLIIFEYSELGIVNNTLRNVSFTDISDSQGHSNGLSLYKSIINDFNQLSKHMSLLQSF